MPSNPHFQVSKSYPLCGWDERDDVCPLDDTVSRYALVTRLLPQHREKESDGKQAGGGGEL